VTEDAKPKLQLSAVKDACVEIANRHHAHMQSMTTRQRMDYMRELVASHEVVIAVFDDPSEADGVGIYVIKGKRKLAEVVASGKTARAKIAAVPCVSLEWAITLDEVLGDSARPKH
jgi:hypothetical protein